MTDLLPPDLEALAEKARADMAEGFATGRDFNAALAAHVAGETQTDDPTADPVPDPGEADEPAPAPQAEPDEGEEAAAGEEEESPAPAAADSITLAGTAWDRSQLEALAQFAGVLRSLPPDRLQHVTDVLEGRWVPDAPVATPAAPQAPPELDLDADPALRYLAERLDALQAQVGSWTDATRRHDDVLNRRELTEAQSLYARARKSFASEHNLSGEQMDKVDANAASLNVLPAMLARTGDRLSALHEAFTLGLRMDDEMYAAELARTAAADRQVAVKKAKAASLSAGSSPAPREAPIPKDQRGRDAALLAMVREAMGAGPAET